ncbi:MAG: hypothetical protein PUE83_04185 [Lachnobacterium sp.]|nr:hypothetical protein [Lachnobacterium sp.]
MKKKLIIFLKICIVTIGLTACGNVDSKEDVSQENMPIINESENTSKVDDNQLYDEMRISEDFKDIIDNLYVIDEHAFTGEIQTKEEFIEKYGEPQQMDGDKLGYLNVEGLDSKYCVRVNFDPQGCYYHLDTVEGIPEMTTTYAYDKEWCIAQNSIIDGEFIDKYFVNGNFTNDYSITKLTYAEIAELLGCQGTVDKMKPGSDEDIFNKTFVYWYCEEKNALLYMTFFTDSGELDGVYCLNYQS